VTCFPEVNLSYLLSDHRNDILSNTFGLAAAIIGAQFPIQAWWVDPVGGIVIGLYIMQNWFRIGIGHIRRLTGLAATPQFLQQITYLAFTHDKRIKKIDTVRAFHLG
jgi:divalent metal cation (Fe/Co/Zn/Cd) transporter